MCKCLFLTSLSSQLSNTVPLSEKQVLYQLCDIHQMTQQTVVRSYCKEFLILAHALTKVKVYVIPRWMSSGLLLRVVR